MNPLITNLPTNDSRINIDTNYTITISDSNLYGANCTLYNGSNASTNVLFSEEYTNLQSTSQQFRFEINTSNGDHEYFMYCSGSDDHTTKSIPDYSLSKQKGMKMLLFDTLSTSIELRLVNATAMENFGDGSKTKNLNLDFVDIDSKKETDRYSISVNYSKQEGKYTYFEYVFNVTSERKMYPRLIC